MASESSTDDTLTNAYESHIGDTSRSDEAQGYWLFALGVVLGFLGMFMFLFSESAGGLRQWAIVLAAAGLVLLIAGPVIRLPLERTATWIVGLGVVISAVAILWFIAAYPGQWSTTTGNLPVIGLYAVGALIVTAGGVFVPVLTDREGNETQVTALQAEVAELRETASEAEREEGEAADEDADLRSALADSESTNTELRSEIDDLEAAVAAAEAAEADAEADLAALLSDHRASQSQFETYEDDGGSWRWRLRHREGAVVASSTEGHASRSAAQQAMQAVRRDAHGATVLHVEREQNLPEPASDDGFVVADAEESQATFELYEDRGDEFRWRLRHDNGNMLVHGGQGYVSRRGAEHSVERFRGYVGPAEYMQPDPTAIDVYRDTEGRWRWRLRHQNGTIFASSGEGYEDRAGARRVIDRLREDVPEAEIEVYEDEAGDFRWRLAGADDLIEANSGGYVSRAGAEDAAEEVRTSLPEADLIDIGEAAFEIYVDEGEQHRWRLRHRNGNVLASSGEGYASRRSVIEGIESVKRDAPNAAFEETDE